MPGKRSVELRVQIHTAVDEKTGCWIWLGHKDKDGYGKVSIKINGENVHLAHRMTYIHYVGEIPKGFELDHLCKNPSCVNPDHLDPVSHLENLNRNTYRRENHRNAKKTHCKHGHEFNEENTRIEVWNGLKMRKCRICNKAKDERSNAKRKLMKFAGHEIVEV